MQCHLEAQSLLLRNGQLRLHHEHLPLGGDQLLLNLLQLLPIGSRCCLCSLAQVLLRTSPLLQFQKGVRLALAALTV
jgi:hypothetical protein